MADVLEKETHLNQTFMFWVQNVTEMFQEYTGKVVHVMIMELFLKSGC